MRHLLTIVLFISATLCANAQLALKTNLLYDATTTPNLGAEVRVGKHSTLNLLYGINPWTFNSESHGERKAKHWILMPEYRWWTCAPFNGHFIGVHLLGGEMNVQNVNLPVPGGFFGGDNLTKMARDHRYQGWMAGGGFTYGYQWILGRHFNLEAEAGVGYARVHYSRYDCGECGVKTATGNTNYLGITKLGLSILYLF